MHACGINWLRWSSAQPRHDLKAVEAIQKSRLDDPQPTQSAPVVVIVE